MLKPGIVGYAFFSPDAIPIKHSWPEEKESIVVHYAALISDLMGRTQQNMKRLFPAPDCDMQSIRIRTQQGTELIITISDNYVMLVIQQVDPPKVAEETEEQAAS